MAPFVYAYIISLNRMFEANNINEEVYKEKISDFFLNGFISFGYSTCYKDEKIVFEQIWYNSKDIKAQIYFKEDMIEYTNNNSIIKLTLTKLLESELISSELYEKEISTYKNKYLGSLYRYYNFDDYIIPFDDHDISEFYYKAYKQNYDYNIVLFI